MDTRYFIDLAGFQEKAIDKIADLPQISENRSHIVLVPPSRSSHKRRNNKYHKKEYREETEAR